MKDLFSAFRGSPRQEEGALAETRACVYLQQQGMAIVDRNYRCKGGEIDLIMNDRDTLVFVEVRKRTHAGFGGAAASITASKKARLLRAAGIYLQRYRFPPACRFDVIAFDGAHIEWMRDALQA